MTAKMGAWECGEAVPCATPTGYVPRVEGIQGRARNGLTCTAFRILLHLLLIVPVKRVMPEASGASQCGISLL